MRHFNPSKDFKRKNNTLFVGMYALFYYICKQITKDMDNYQVFKVRLLWKIIDKILHLKDSQVKGLSYIPSNNTINIGKDNKLHLCFKRKYNNEFDNDLYRVLPEFELQNGDETFVIPYGFAVFNNDIEVDFDKELDFEIKINRIDYGNAEEKLNYYWRYVYPINFDRWFLQMESLNYIDDDNMLVCFSYLVTKIGNSDMHVFLTERKGNYYIVIQSGCKINSEEMFKRVFAIKTTLGLVTGNILGDYQFQIASDDKEFDTIKSVIFGTLEDTKYCYYRIVNNKWVTVYDLLGQFEYQKYAKKMLEDSGYDPKSYYDTKPVEAKVVDGLVNLLYNNNDLAISASMLLEGSQLNLIYQPLFYHVALETITSALMNDFQEKKVPPLGKNEYNKTVRPVLLKALDSIIDIPTDAKRIYSNRIKSSFNSPTNQDKLTKCFADFGYNLSEADKNAIKQRNFTLHGHLSDIKKEIANQRWDMFSTALRLHKLCCILLLKAADYTGKILNNEVIMGVKEACERKDPPYLYI